MHLLHIPQKTCLEDSYPLFNIDKFVNNLAKYKLVSFTYAYSKYNQIPMHEADKENITFMMEHGNYRYNVMPFGLKKADSTYQKNDEKYL